MGGVSGLHVCVYVFDLCVYGWMCLGMCVLFRQRESPHNIMHHSPYVHPLVPEVPLCTNKGQ